MAFSQDAAPDNSRHHNQNQNHDDGRMGPPSLLESITGAHGGLGPKLTMEDLLSVPVDRAIHRDLRAGGLRQRIEGEAIPLA